MKVKQVILCLLTTLYRDVNYGIDYGLDAIVAQHRLRFVAFLNEQKEESIDDPWKFYQDYLVKYNEPTYIKKEEFSEKNIHKRLIDF